MLLLGVLLLGVLLLGVLLLGVLLLGVLLLGVLLLGVLLLGVLLLGVSFAFGVHLFCTSVVFSSCTNISTWFYNLSNSLPESYISDCIICNNVALVYILWTIRIHD